MAKLINSIRWALSRVFAIMALGIGVGSLVGYLFGVPSLLIWSTNGVPIALPTACALTLLSLSSLLKTNPPF